MHDRGCGIDSPEAPAKLQKSCANAIAWTPKKESFADPSAISPKLFFLVSHNEVSCRRFRDSQSFDSCRPVLRPKRYALLTP